MRPWKLREAAQERLTERMRETGADQRRPYSFSPSASSLTHAHTHKHSRASRSADQARERDLGIKSTWKHLSPSALFSHPVIPPSSLFRSPSLRSPRFVISSPALLSCISERERERMCTSVTLSSRLDFASTPFLSHSLTLFKRFSRQQRVSLQQTLSHQQKNTGCHPQRQQEQSVKGASFITGMGNLRIQGPRLCISRADAKETRGRVSSRQERERESVPTCVG